MLQTVILLLHVLTAVFGIGLIGAMAVVCVTVGSESPAPAVMTSLRRLTRTATWSVLVMLITGVLLDLAAARAFDRTWWFRGSTLLILLLGYLLARTQRALRKADPGFVATVRGLAFGMSAIVAVLVVLMVVKPG
jgi:hypothetical protein